MGSSLRKPIVTGVIAGALTAVAVFGGTGAFLAAAQDTTDTTQSPDTTAPDTTAPDTTAPDTTAPDQTAPDQTAPDQTAPDQTAPDQQSADEWRQCMADHGVDVPAPPTDGTRPDRSQRPQLDESEREAARAAVEACGPPPGRGHFGPGGAGGPGGPGGHKDGQNCPNMGGSSDQAPGDSAPSDTAPSAEPSSFRV